MEENPDWVALKWDQSETILITLIGEASHSNILRSNSDIIIRMKYNISYMKLN
jgi:hypothetical protein